MTGKIIFSNLSDADKKRLCVSPQHVPSTKNSDEETTEQIISRQSKFVSLPELTRLKLHSEETIAKIERLGENYNLELLQLATISRTIRNYYFGEIKTADFPRIFSQEIGLDPKSAQEISNSVIRQIINAPEEVVRDQSQFEKIVLKKALQKYPEIGEQLITSFHLKLKSFPDPVRPSVKNWLSDYTFNLGYDTKDTVAIGRYLYQNENAKVLNLSDRQKLTYILKTYSEDAPVEINLNTKQIIFPQKLSPSESSSILSKENRQKIDFPKKDSAPLYDPFERKTFASNPILKNNEKAPSSLDLRQKKQDFPLLQKNIISPESNSNLKNKILSSAFNPTSQTQKKPLGSAVKFGDQLSKEKITFSSPQKMPFEKQLLDSKKVAPISTIQPKKEVAVEPALSTTPQPLRIYSSQTRSANSSLPEEAIPQYNVINLKEKE